MSATLPAPEPDLTMTRRALAIDQRKGDPANGRLIGTYNVAGKCVLIDATAEEKEIIEARIGITFSFDGKRISWKPKGKST